MNLIKSKKFVTGVTVFGIVSLFLVAGIYFLYQEYLNQEQEVEMESEEGFVEGGFVEGVVYQGPVRPTDDEEYFRKTGITRPKEIE